MEFYYSFLLSAISPAVVVPTVLTLKETVKGINEGIVATTTPIHPLSLPSPLSISSGITTLIVAAANIDVVISISLFSIFLGLIFSEGTGLLL